MTTKPVTKAVRLGIETDEQFGAVVPPLHLSTNFSFAGLGEKRHYDYSRSGNPTRDLLGTAIAEAEGGAGGVVTSSGMAAITLVTQLLQPGDLLLAPHDCYGGSFRLFSSLAEQGRFDLLFLDQNDPEQVAAALARKPAILWIETPSNPLLRIVDIKALAAAAKRVGCLAAVDNTFLSPALQQPLALGADLVVHSTTKYLNGHSDVVGGAVVSAEAELHEKMAWWANCLGLTGAPFDAFLTLRGMRSLHARMRVHQENAAVIAEFLGQQEQIERVFYPGLVDHPGHRLAASQQAGFGAMLSFELRGGESAVRTFVDGLEHFSLAESLGGVESLIAHPATMTHAAMSPPDQRAAGIGPGLLRLSIGIEAVEDLVADLTRAFARLSEPAAVHH